MPSGTQLLLQLSVLRRQTCICAYLPSHLQLEWYREAPSGGFQHVEFTRGNNTCAITYSCRIKYSSGQPISPKRKNDARHQAGCSIESIPKLCIGVPQEMGVDGYQHSSDFQVTRFKESHEDPQHRLHKSLCNVPAYSVRLETCYVASQSSLPPTTYHI